MLPWINCIASWETLRRIPSTSFLQKCHILMTSTQETLPTGWACSSYPWLFSSEEKKPDQLCLKHSPRWLAALFNSLRFLFVTFCSLKLYKDLQLKKGGKKPCNRLPLFWYQKLSQCQYLFSCFHVCFRLVSVHLANTGCQWVFWNWILSDTFLSLVSGVCLP